MGHFRQTRLAQTTLDASPRDVAQHKIEPTSFWQCLAPRIIPHHLLNRWEEIMLLWNRDSIPSSCWSLCKSYWYMQFLRRRQILSKTIIFLLLVQEGLWAAACFDCCVLGKRSAMLFAVIIVRLLNGVGMLWLVNSYPQAHSQTPPSRSQDLWSGRSKPLQGSNSFMSQNGKV